MIRVLVDLTPMEWEFGKESPKRRLALVLEAAILLLFLNFKFDFFLTLS